MRSELKRAAMAVGLALGVSCGAVGAEGVAPLVVQSVRVEGKVAPGRTVTVVYEIANVAAAATGARDDGIFLSADRRITPSDLPLGFARRTGLDGGESAKLWAEVTLPTRLPDGVYYVGVLPDLASEVSKGSLTSDASVAVTLGAGGVPAGAPAAAAPSGPKAIPDGLFLIASVDDPSTETLENEDGRGHCYLYVQGGKVVQFRGNGTWAGGGGNSTASVGEAPISSSGKFSFNLDASGAGSLSLRAESGMTRLTASLSARRAGLSAVGTATGQFAPSGDDIAGTYRWRFRDTRSRASATLGSGTWTARRGVPPLTGSGPEPGRSLRSDAQFRHKRLLA